MKKSYTKKCWNLNTKYDIYIRNSFNIMIMNEKFRWFVIEDNFLDKEECGSLIKQIDENGIRTHDDTSDDDSDFIHRR